jgi:hypothetical protein
MVGSPDLTAIETLRKRFKARASLGLSLARAYRFVAELEPLAGDGRDPFVEVAQVFREWRQALRDGDADRCLDAVERSFVLLDVCRQRVIARDAAIEAYRVRWACENAPLPDRTVDSLARFYRLLPFSQTSQSKYEYVLTRRLAGPIGPERRIAGTEVLEDAVRAFEAAWSAPAVGLDLIEAATIRAALKAFGDEAAQAPDAATFTAGAILRRFSTYKVSLGPKLLDFRVSVAIVETNVRVLNSWNQLLADAGGKPLKGHARAGTSRGWAPHLPPGGAPLDAVLAAPPSAAPNAGISASPGSTEPPAGRNHPNLLTGEIDISGLELVRAMRKRRTAEIARGDGPTPAPPQTPESQKEVVPSPETPASREGTPEPSPASLKRADLRTGEVDLSGLEFVRRLRARVTSGGTPVDDEGPEESGALAEAPSGSAPPAEGDESAGFEDAEQLPSPRAFELGKIEENASIIDRYLTTPRSPEVWQLDLDVFLGRGSGGAANAGTSADRRRALELILNSDDLICARATQDDAPSPEHRAQVRSVANAMLLLRTSLRRGADLARGNASELEPLLYVADHLLWERLRLESSLKRRPSRSARPVVLPRSNEAAELALQQVRAARRQRRILIRVVAAAAAVTTIAGLLTSSIPKEIIDPEVRLVQVSGLPGAALFDDARMFRTTLFVSVSRTWTLLSAEEKRSIVRGLGTFAGERGMTTVSVVGPKGEPWATLKDDEVLLDGELHASDLAKR